jgi:kumamolisin
MSSVSSLVVHIPNELEKHPLKETASNKGLSIVKTYNKIKSFVVKGTDAQIEDFKSSVEEYSQFSVSHFDSTPLKHVKHGIKAENVIPLDLKPEQNTYFTSAQLAQIYGVPNSASNPRVNIGIIELGGGFNAAADLTPYWQYLGLTTVPNVYAVSVDGATNNYGTSGADYEVALDIEAVGGVCPNSNIYVFFAPNTYSGFVDAINTAAFGANPCKIISISWSGVELYWSTNALTAFNNALQQVASAGVTVCVSSGDSGSDNGAGKLCVNFPSSSPNVLCVGGTTLLAGPNYTYSSEKGWGIAGNLNYGSGGGLSSFFPIPSYQQGVLPSSTTMRALPDVSSDGDPSSGMLTRVRGAWYIIAGTSLSAPLWAGTLAALNYKGFLNPQLYKIYSVHPNVVNDVTVGTNGGYSCTAGFDEVTGLGSQNGPVLASLLGGCTC